MVHPGKNTGILLNKMPHFHKGTYDFDTDFDCRLTSEHGRKHRYTLFGKHIRITG
jgi:hypothetical protein